MSEQKQREKRLGLATYLKSTRSTGMGEHMARLRRGKPNDFIRLSRSEASRLRLGEDMARL